MEQEIFEVPFNYNGQQRKAEVRTVMQKRPVNADHEIWINGSYAFTMNPQEEDCRLCWKVKEPGIDLEFVSVIVEAIETRKQ